jgi:hypothetical protein
VENQELVLAKQDGEPVLDIPSVVCVVGCLFWALHFRPWVKWKARKWPCCTTILLQKPSVVITYDACRVEQSYFRFEVTKTMELILRKVGVGPKLSICDVGKLLQTVQFQVNVVCKGLHIHMPRVRHILPHLLGLRERKTRRGNRVKVREC